MQRTLFVYALLALLSLQLVAQGPVATLSGEIRDPSGAVVPLAIVTVRNVATGVVRKTPTNEAGVYTMTSLPPGTYEIIADAAGFKRVERNAITLEVAQDARIDFQLEVGAASDVVEVTSEAPVTDTESASTGTVIDNKKVVELPLNGRQFYNLALLVTGTTMPAENSTDGFRGGFNVSGRVETDNNFTVNGVDNNDMANGSPSVRPSIDDIQEFKLLTGVYSAEYGRSSGGQVIVVTKSGSNDIHGTAFEFLRNQKLDASNFFTQAGSKPSYRRNNFGGTIGGPIIKNKTFFHFSYEGLRLAEQVAALGTVPTAAEDAGDFSTLLNAAKPTAIKNPLTGAPFPNNQIPASLISPIGQALLKAYPAPTSTTFLGAPVNNFTLNGVQSEEMNEYSVRIDHQISMKDSLYATYLLFFDPIYYVYNSLCGSSVLPNGGCYTGWTGQLFGLAENHVFTPSLVNEVHAGIQRMRQPRIQTDNTIDFWSQFPYVTNVGPNVADNNGVPSASITGYSKLGGPTNLPQNRWDTVYDYHDTLSWQHGTHSLKVGLQFRDFDENFLYVASGRGVLTFNASAQAPTSGYALADALLGYPTSTSNNPLAPNIYGRTKGLYAFVQDDWRITKTFTLNLGLRWELNTPYHDASNRLAWFNQATGQMEVAGQNGAPDQLYNTDYKKFAPRLGFAYQPFGNSKTVIRGGAGLFNDNLVLFNGIGSVLLNPPFRSPASYTSSVAAPITLSDPFPLGSASGYPSVGGSIANFTLPTVYEWSTSIQRELPQDTLIDVTYFGSKGSYLPISPNINQPPPGPGTAAQVQARRPFPAYAGITEYESGGNSHYESLQIKLEKRYAKGLAVLFSETFARSIDDTPESASTSDSSRATPQNSFNIAEGERGLSDFNVKSRAVLSIVGELPFGKGKPWLSQGWGGKIAGGWQLSAIFTDQTGRPWTPYFSANNSNTNESADRPNAVMGCDPYSGFQKVSMWVSPACFTTPTFGTFGNLGRNTLIGPGLIDLDFAVDRNFQLSDRFRLQFRGELFNIANHPNFNLPSTGYDSPSFSSLISAMDPREIQFGLKLIF